MVLCLAKELDVPDIGGGALRLSGLARVYKLLSRRRMRTNQRHGVAGVEAHISKPLDQNRNGALHIWKQSIWGSILGLRPANPVQLYLRSACRIAVSEFSDVSRVNRFVPGQITNARIPATWRRSPLETPTSWEEV